MDLIRLVTSRWGGPLVKKLGNILPRSLSYAACRWAAGGLGTRRDHPFLNALRANMAVVHRMDVDDPRLDQVVTKLLCHALYCYVDLFKIASAGTEAQLDSCDIEVNAACEVDGPCFYKYQVFFLAA